MSFVLRGYGYDPLFLIFLPLCPCAKYAIFPDAIVVVVLYTLFVCFIHRF